ncbi:MAG TPA: nuclear transport factor 2 family protein [Xanthomonadales bacterium]|nr:nuclear transport factor 2 family protein [Xanthomonadales bacterium]
MTGSNNRELIKRLYAALDRRDGEAMASCYAPDATFRDPVFTLAGSDVGDMWRMLTSRATDLRCEASDVEADALTGAANWVAHYTYSGTGRHVVNRIHAQFRFRDGAIAEHVDQFNLWKWASQAIGLPGTLLGWTPMVRGKIRRQAAAALARFSAERRARLDGS